MMGTLAAGLAGKKIATFEDRYWADVEGDVENHDQILYVGTKIADVFDNSDFKEMEGVLRSEDTHLINFFQELLNARLDKKSFGFIFHYLIT